MILCVVLFFGIALASAPDKAQANNVNYQYQPYPYGTATNYPYGNANYPYNSASKFPQGYPNYPHSSATYPYRNYPYNSNYPYAGNFNLNSPYYSNRYSNNLGLNPYYNNYQRILRYNNNNNGNGNYQFDYETENGIKQQEVGQLKRIDSPYPATVVQGSYSYVAPNGQTYTVNYVADENGFQPTGDHIPLQKSYLTHRYAGYRQYYNSPQYGAPSYKY